MRLENVTAKIRPRGRWESIDLGCAMARRSYGTILMAWLITVWPLWIGGIYLMGTFMSPGAHVFFSAFWCWLTLQIAGKIPLFVMSRKLFGEEVSVFTVFKEWWTSMIFKNFWSRIIGRFSAARGLSLPVAELEGLKGHAYKSRVNLLSRNGGDGAVQAILVCWLMQLVMIASCYFFVGLVIGLYGETDVLEMITVDLNRYGDEHAGWWLLFFFYLLSVTIIEPFFIGAGFAMYVNSRTVTEGWDIELIFKRLSERLKTMYINKGPSRAGEKSSGSGLAGGEVTPSVAPALATPPSLSVSKGSPAPPTLSKAKIPPSLIVLGALLGMLAFSSPQAVAGDARVDRIMKSDDFDLNRSSSQEFESTRSSGSSSSRGSGSYSGSYSPRSSPVGNTAGLFSGVFTMLFWAAIILAVAAVIWVIYKNRKALAKGGLSSVDDDAPKVKSVMGMDVTPESLPKEIHEVARDAWLRGEHQLAMSLLYRGSISWMVNQARVPIIESDTEEDCLRRVKSIQLGADIGSYFKGVTTNWVRLAYGKKLPTDNVFMKLCDHWPFTKKKVVMNLGQNANEEGVTA